MSVLQPPESIIYRFCSHPETAEVTTLGQGNINDTYLVRTKEKSIILQQINGRVFPDPQILIDNLHTLSQHLSSLSHPQKQRWEDAILLPALDGSFSVCDHKGAVWRALSYIGDSTCFSHAETRLQAEQTGWALGQFHKRLIGLDMEKIRIPLPGFHHLERYLQHYAQLKNEKKGSTSPEIQFCRYFIRENRERALILEQSVSRKRHPARIVHGDPKIANVLFDKKNGLAISLIDLDTVGPGLLQHDIGDCLRSVCNRSGEESELNKVTFDLDLCEATLEGYFETTEEFLTPGECELFYDGILAITYELGLRFFMDYLQGGHYFKCKTPEETLKKAQVQLTLLQDIIAKEVAIRTLIQQLSQ